MRFIDEKQIVKKTKDIMAGLEEGLLSSILSPDGTGLAVTSRSLHKSVRSNDRLYRYGDKSDISSEHGDSLDSEDSNKHKPTQDISLMP